MTFAFQPPPWLQRWRTWILLSLMTALAVGLFAQVRHFEFLNFDDPVFIATNPWIKDGITWEGVKWAFSANLLEASPRAEYWGPITLLSRMADIQLYGLNAGGHHVTSALLHLLNSCLLFGAMFALTREWGKSALVALIFLVHPLNIEAIAWLSARKDLLSATFLFLTLAAYGHYARLPSRGRYALLGMAFVGGLMSKPMGVTTPFLLLVLDFWPLQRWHAARANRQEQFRLVAEKLPLLLLAAAAAASAAMSQNDRGAMSDPRVFPLSLRLGNAVLSYGTYLRRMFWPVDLAIYYPHPGPAIAWAHVALALGVLVILSVASLLLHRRFPYLLAGWLWFLGVLVPVIGLVQIGSHAMADRYAYAALPGFWMAVIWLCWPSRNARAQTASFHALAAVTLVGSLAWVSSGQLASWRNSQTVFRRAIAVTQNNDTAYQNLGTDYAVKGQWQLARDNFAQSLRIRPLQLNGWNNLAAAEAALGNDEAALQAYSVALQINPALPKTHFYLGKLLLKHGQIGPGEAAFTRAMELAPDWAEPSKELARSLSKRGNSTQAVSILSRYLAHAPADREVQALLEQIRASAPEPSPASP